MRIRYSTIIEIFNTFFSFILFLEKNNTKLIKKTSYTFAGTSKLQQLMHNASLYTYICNGYSFFYLFSYSNPLVKSSIWALKYENNPQSIAFFAECLLDEIIGLASSEMRYFSETPSIILTIIPSSSYVFGKRNWDQMSEVALYICKCLGASAYIQSYEHIFNMLSDKEKNSLAQHSADKSTRYKLAHERLHIKDGFISELSLLKNKIIFIIDDVCTSGATLSRAHELCEPYARHVISIAISHPDFVPIESFESPQSTACF